MNELQWGVKLALYAVMGLSVIAALGTVMLPNLFRSALALIGVLLGSAVIFLSLHADFLAAVQVLLYVGAVMTLVIFVIMLTQRLNDKTLIQRNSQSIAAAIASVVFLFMLVKTILKTSWPIPTSPVPPVEVSDLGVALMGEYVFPFEVISVVLLATLVGAIVIAKKDKPA